MLIQDFFDILEEKSQDQKIAEVDRAVMINLLEYFKMITPTHRVKNSSIPTGALMIREILRFWNYQLNPRKFFKVVNPAVEAEKIETTDLELPEGFDFMVTRLPADDEIPDVQLISRPTEISVSEYQLTAFMVVRFESSSDMKLTSLDDITNLVDQNSRKTQAELLIRIVYELTDDKHFKNNFFDHCYLNDRKIKHEFKNGIFNRIFQYLKSSNLREFNDYSIEFEMLDREDKIDFTIKHKERDKKIFYNYSKSLCPIEIAIRYEEDSQFDVFRTTTDLKGNVLDFESNIQTDKLLYFLSKFTEEYLRAR